MKVNTAFAVDGRVRCSQLVMSKEMVYVLYHERVSIKEEDFVELGHVPHVQLVKGASWMPSSCYCSHILHVWTLTPRAFDGSDRVVEGEGGNVQDLYV